MASISHSGRRVAQRDVVHRASGATYPNGLGSPPKAAHQGPVAARNLGRFLEDVPHRPANRAYPRGLGGRSNGSKYLGSALGSGIWAGQFSGNFADLGRALVVSSTLGIALCQFLAVPPAMAQAQDPTTVAPTETPSQPFDAGVKAYDSGEYTAAHDIWLPWAHRGDPAAQRNLAHLYRMGLGVSQDFVQAASWYRLAADSGLARAQANLAAMYLRGQGVAQDAKEAAFWFTSAATNGHALAQYNLALLYLRGEGVERSEAKAAGWLYLATKAGYEPAIRALARLVPAISGPAGPPSPSSRPPSSSPSSPRASPPASQQAGKPAKTPTSPIVQPAAAKPEPAKVAPAVQPPPAAVDKKAPVVAAKQPVNQSTDQAAGKVEEIANTKPDAEATISLDTILSFFENAQDSDLSRDHDVTLAGHSAEVTQRNLTAGLVALHTANYGIARDRWLPLAENGNAEAQFQLGKLYLHTGFVEANRPWGYFWLTQAAKRQHPGAITRKESLRNSMTDDERDAAQKLIEDVRLDNSE